MEVATGEIRAVANLSKVTEGVYKEKFNYAIAQSAEPGSTFKLASYLALLEDKKVDTNTLVDAEGGTYKVYNNRNRLVKIVKDSHLGLKVISVKKAFEESSNAVIAKLIYKHYLNDADQFTSHLRNNLHLNTRAGLQIPGEGKPMIKTPESKFWYKGLSLAQMAYGYEMQMTPLQMLTFYNAVANDGKMVAPMFVREIRRFGNTVENFETRVIEEKIASAETIGKLQGMLEGVVEEGTGKTVIKNPLYKIAGKTGTAQIADGKLGYKGKRSYQASFVGYFPANKPKYSMIVIITNPVGEYYAAFVAGPVFREVADMVYANDVTMYNPVKEIEVVKNGLIPEAKAGQKKATKSVYNAFGINTVFASAGEYINTVDTSLGVKTREIVINEGFVPDVLGMGLKDALYLVGNSGLKPYVKGRGKVTKQSLVGGMRVGKGSSIVLELE
jgi:cell division protein FtsI (penicillin-binding protein 3)